MTPDIQLSLTYNLEESGGSDAQDPVGIVSRDDLWRSGKWADISRSQREVPCDLCLRSAARNLDDCAVRRRWPSVPDDDRKTPQHAEGKRHRPQLHHFPQGHRSLDEDNFWLHKFRATFATRCLWAGVDLRTVQQWLGHSDMESTMRYLKPSRSQQTREKVNEIFA
jgi:integrase